MAIFYDDWEVFNSMLNLAVGCGIWEAKEHNPDVGPAPGLL